MKKLVVAISGGTLLLVGVAMLALPGPAVLVIPAGLAILATEFLWARQALRKCKGMVAKTRRNLRWRRCNRKQPAVPQHSPTQPASPNSANTPRARPVLPAA